MRITEARYVPQLNAFFTLEEGQSRVTVYRASPRDARDANSGFEVLGYMEGEATVFGFEYIDELNVVVLAQGNLSLKFWDCRPTLERGGDGARERAKARAAAGGKEAPGLGQEEEEEKEELEEGAYGQGQSGSGTTTTNNNNTTTTATATTSATTRRRPCTRRPAAAAGG
jgi:hypothetical protein